MDQSRVVNVLLLALVQTLTEWTGGGWAEITMVGTGRDMLPQAHGIDLSRTIGYLSASKVLVLQRVEAEEPAAALRALEEQIRTIPNQGYGYLLLALGGYPEFAGQLKARRKEEINFNYFGRTQPAPRGSSPFRMAQESTGTSWNPQQQRTNLLMCRASITDGHLTVEWLYSRNLYAEATIDCRARRFMEYLRWILANDQM
jgi:non-ribosomal peptide synthase protein (TIGR01720 family)